MQVTFILMLGSIRYTDLNKRQYDRSFVQGLRTDCTCMADRLHLYGGLIAPVWRTGAELHCVVKNLP